VLAPAHRGLLEEAEVAEVEAKIGLACEHGAAHAVVELVYPEAHYFLTWSKCF